MAKKTRPAVVLVQPWTFVKSYSQKMDELVSYLSKFRSAKVDGFVILINYSTHMMPGLYDISNYKILIEINDPADLMVDEADIDDGEAEQYDSIDEEMSMSAAELTDRDRDDYWKNALIDPDGEGAKWFKASVSVDRDFDTWRIMNNYGGFENIPGTLKDRIDADLKEKRAVLLRYDEQGATMVNAVSKAIKEENKRNEVQIDEVHILGGWGNDCVEWVIDNAESLKSYQIKLLGKLIVMKKFTDFMQYYKESLSGRIQRKTNMTIEDRDPVEALEHDFDLD